MLLQSRRRFLTQVETKVILVRGREVRLPVWLPDRGWAFHVGGQRLDSSGGWVRWDSNGGARKGLKQGNRLHRVVMQRVLLDNKLWKGAPGQLTPEWHVHHMDGNRANNCPCNLVMLPAKMNPALRLQCPFTGLFLSREEHERRLGGKGMHWAAGEGTRLISGKPVLLRTRKEKARQAAVIKRRNREGGWRGIKGKVEGKEEVPF